MVSKMDLIAPQLLPDKVLENTFYSCVTGNSMTDVSCTCIYIYILFKHREKLQLHQANKHIKTNALRMQ